MARRQVTMLYDGRPDARIGEDGRQADRHPGETGKTEVGRRQQPREYDSDSKVKHELQHLRRKSPTACVERSNLKVVRHGAV
jgi:hypothetical protein